jgi:hypothetical protein
MTSEAHPPGHPARPLPGQRPQLVALATVLSWNVLALAGWLGYVIAVTRQEPDWGDLAALAGAMLGVGAFVVSVTIGGVAVAVISRRSRWRQSVITAGGAVRSGTLAAATGLMPFLVFLLVAVLVELFAG